MSGVNTIKVATSPAKKVKKKKKKKKKTKVVFPVNDKGPYKRPEVDSGTSSENDEMESSYSEVETNEDLPSSSSEEV